MKQMHCVHRDMSPMHPRRDGIQQSVAGPFVTILPHGIVLWFVGVRPVVPVVGAVGAVGVTNVEGVPSVDGLRPGIPIVEGEMPGTGTTTSGLTPALPISTEPIGIPGWETRLGDSLSRSKMRCRQSLHRSQGHRAKRFPLPSPHQVPFLRRRRCWYRTSRRRQRRWSRLCLRPSLPWGR
jgi:hypothetical protein